MKKSSQKALALLLIIPVAVVLSLPYLSTHTGIQFYSVGDAFTLSVLPNKLISCTIDDQLYVKFTGQSPQLASDASGGTINPMIYYDLVQRNTRESIDTLPEKFVLNCDISKADTEVDFEGSLLISISASDSKGVYHNLPLKTVTIPKQPVISKTNMPIASYTISQSEINNALDKGNGDYTSWVIVDTAPYIKFTIPLAVSTSTYSGTDLETSYLARVVNSIPVQQIATQGIQNNIQDFNPKTFALPFAANQGFLTVTGQEDHWTTAEGLPWIQFVDPTGYKYPKVKFSSYSNTDGDIWTEFKLTIQLPQNAKAGTWQLTMGSDQPTRPQLAQRTFAVTAAANIPTSSGNGNPIVTNPVVNATSGVTGKVFFNYKENFDGETKSGAAPSPTYDINLKALDLTTAGKTGDVALSDIFAETILQLTDPKYQSMNIQDSQISTSVSVSINGNTYLFNQLEVTPTIVNSKDTNNNYHFTSVGVTGNQIEQKLTENGNPPPDSKTPIYVTVESHGTFTLKDGSGKQYQGQMQGAAITFNLDYVKPTGLNNNPNNNSGTCSITNLAACLNQQNNTSSGGNPTQCTDSNGNVIQCPSQTPTGCSNVQGTNLIGNQCGTSNNSAGGSSSTVGGNPNNNPNGSNGIAGLCPNGLTDLITCGQYLASQLPAVVPNENTFVDIFAFLIVILIIVVVVKKLRK